MSPENKQQSSSTRQWRYFTLLQHGTGVAHLSSNCYDVLIYSSSDHSFYAIFFLYVLSKNFGPLPLPPLLHPLPTSHHFPTFTPAPPRPCSRHLLFCLACPACPACPWPGMSDGSYPHRALHSCLSLTAKYTVFALYTVTTPPFTLSPHRPVHCHHTALYTVTTPPCTL